MTGLHTIYRAQGDQSLVHYPPRGVVAATYVIEDMSVSETDPNRVIAQGSATVDTLSETTVAAAGPRALYPQRVGITASAAVVGRTYRLTSADGVYEHVVIGSVAATSVNVTGRLSATYPIGSTLEGAEIRCTFPSAAAAREDLQEEARVLVVRWSYEVNGVLHRPVEQVRVVRNTPEVAAWMVPAMTALKAEWHELCQILGSDDVRLRALVSGCARELMAGLRSMSQDPASLLMGEQGFDLLMRRCVYRFAEMGHCPAGRDKDQWAEQQRRHWLALYNAVSKGGGNSTAEIEPGDNVATKRERKPMFKSA